MAIAFLSLTTEEPKNKSLQSYRPSKNKQKTKKRTNHLMVLLHGVDGIVVRVELDERLSVVVLPAVIPVNVHHLRPQWGQELKVYTSIRLAGGT